MGCKVQLNLGSGAIFQIMKSSVLLTIILICGFSSAQLQSTFMKEAQNRYKDPSLGASNREYGSQVLKNLFLDNLLPGFIEELGLLDEAERDTLLHRAIRNVSADCRTHVDYSLNYLFETVLLDRQLPDTWLLQMVDAWGKFPSGILAGHTAEPGDFLECVQVRATNKESEYMYKGSYCSMYIFPYVEEIIIGDESSGSKISNLPRHAMPRKIEDIEGLIQGMFNAYGVLSNPFVGICFPSSCSVEDTTEVVNFLLNQIGLSGGIVQCYTDDKPPLDNGDITIIIVLGVIGTLCLLGTAVDLLYAQNLDKPADANIFLNSFVAFSVYTNTKRLLNTKEAEGNLGCIHGLRFLSMCWVILGHSWLLILYQMSWNLVDVTTMWDSWTLTPILNATIGVDTFIVMGGCLVAYNLLKELDRTNGRVNIPLMYLHRYLRLTPTYIILIGILATLAPYAGSGPMWFIMDNESYNCEQNWWHNLLYINNLISYNETGICYGESWYLANDMQYFILSPLLIYPLWKSKILGFTLLGVASVGTLVANFLLTYYKELEPTLAIFTPVDNYMKYVYQKPYTRVGPYLAGIMVGYLLHSTKGKKVKLPTWLAGIFWTASTVLALVVVYGAKPYIDPTNHEKATTSGLALLYAGLHRYIWGVVIAWIIFACVKGYGGPVNRFLSWKAFIPLGRLTYCVYISSFHVQMLYHLTLLHPVHYSTYGMINVYFAHLFMTLLTGFICTITIESPFMQLEKLLLPTRKSE